MLVVMDLLFGVVVVVVAVVLFFAVVETLGLVVVVAVLVATLVDPTMVERLEPGNLVVGFAMK